MEQQIGVSFSLSKINGIKKFKEDSKAFTCVTELKSPKEDDAKLDEVFSAIKDEWSATEAMKNFSASKEKDCVLLK